MTTWTYERDVDDYVSTILTGLKLKKRKILELKKI